MSSQANFICIFLILYCLAVVANAQQQLTRIITNTENKQVTVQLESFPIRSRNFGVLVEEGTGRFTSFVAAAPRTYLGTVSSYPGAMVSALLKPSGTLLCRISFEDGSEWSSTGGIATIRANNTSWKPQWPTTLIPTTSANSIMYEAEVGVDASYSAYVASGSDVQSVLDIVEFAIMAANVPFIRDASILHKVGKVVIRKSGSKNLYQSDKTTILLDEVRDVWNGPLLPIVGRTHHLAMVSRPGDIGGLAWVGMVATGLDYAYSANGGDANGDFSVIWRHEAGHNWGADHYDGGGNPEGPTIMSDNQLSRFSSSELLNILLHKAKVPQLANRALVISRPPRANMDAIVLQNRQPLTLDVLANDLDADFQRLTLISVSNPTAAGGTTQISRPSGSRGQVVYTPSGEALISGDSFSYTIENVQGKTSTGYVMLSPFALVGWWKMFESEGDTVKDWSRNAATGNIIGSATWNQGLVFNGATTVSLGTKPSLSGQTSFSLCVRVRTTSTSTSVLIQQRSPPSSTTDGFNGEYKFYLRDGATPALLVFGGSATQFDFTSSTKVNDGKWHFIVAVRDGTQGRIYIDNRLSASANGPVRNLDGNIPVFMGSDARDNAEFFSGALNRVRIYNRALSLNEIVYISSSPELTASIGGVIPEHYVVV